MMTEQEQRSAIAEWMGTLYKECGCAENHHALNVEGCQHPMLQSPNYPNDLNAMHKAEKKLSAKEARIYNGYLEEIAHVNSKRDKCGSDGYKYFLEAPEKSEALCRTLWPERFEE